MFGLITLITIPSLFFLSMIGYLVIGIIKMDKNGDDSFEWNNDKQ